MPQISYYAKHMLSSEDSRAPPLCSLISRKAIKNICGSDCDDVYVPAIDGWHIRTCEHADIQTHHMCVIVPRTLGNISASINCLGHSSLKTAIIYTYNRWNRCATPLILSRTRRHLSTVKSVHPVRVFFIFLLRLRYCYYYFAVDNPRHSRLLCRWLFALASMFACTCTYIYPVVPQHHEIGDYALEMLE